MDLLSIILIFNAIILIVVTFLAVKLLGTNRHNEEDIRLQLNALTQQLQHTEQQLREHLLINFGKLQEHISDKLGQYRLEQHQQAKNDQEQFQQHRLRFDERQMETLKILQDTLHKGTEDNRHQIKTALKDYTEDLGKRIDQLTLSTENKLKEINQQVERRLAEGFEKTNETFIDVIKRLALIDAAQKKISELSNNVVNLQEILNDKRSRGAFGEVQLSALIRNMIPEQHFSFQHLLKNNKRPDCMLFLPEPTGNIAIDAKFPLENYRLLIDSSLGEAAKGAAERQFKIDIRKHIQDIAAKYIIPGETADGAMMFIPAEAVFAEIHAHHPDLVSFAQQAKVWMVSPTTMMAILSTVRAVLKDAATKKQVLEIQKHLRSLAQDFERFQIRMNQLTKHIAQAHTDAEQIHISSQKISQRFVQIEQADLSHLHGIHEGNELTQETVA